MASEKLNTTLPRSPGWAEDSARSRPSGISYVDLLTALFLPALFIVCLASVQFSTPALVGTDGYYHVKIARIMATEGLVLDFPWLPLTILNERAFYDHHFLFHVALIPFTGFDLLAGAKWASVIFASSAFLGFWWVLRQRRIRHPTLWSMGLLVVSDAFLFRMSMVRAQSLSLLVLVVGLHWMFSGRYRRLMLLGFLYVWLYDGFPLLLILASLFLVGKWLTEGELVFQPVLYSALGIGLGLLINPYFPDDILFIFRHILPKLAGVTSIRVGNEWYPYQTKTLLDNSQLALVAFIGGALALGLNRRRMSVATATSFLASVMFGWMLFQSRRFIEYFPPFSLMFAAFSWSDLLPGKPAAIGASLSQSSSPSRPLALSNRQVGWLEGVALGIILVVGAWRTVPAAMESVSNSQPYDRYAASATWLAQNSPEGSRVFQTDWDDFTRLFYHNTHNTYLVGLDPTYLLLYDSVLYDLWARITDGTVENPSKVIAEVFEAEYVFSDLGHTDFVRQAEGDPGLREIYRDHDSVIYQVAP